MVWKDLSNESKCILESMETFSGRKPILKIEKGKVFTGLMSRKYNITDKVFNEITKYIQFNEDREIYDIKIYTLNENLIEIQLI